MSPYRILIVEAKKNLYRTFLRMPNEMIQERDFDIMDALVRDRDIQDCLEAAKVRKPL